MTTWTTPRTWGTGDLVTADDLNEQLRDNLTFLKGATTFASVLSDSSYASTVNSTFVDVDANNLTLTVTTRGTLALLGFETAVYQSTSSQAICFDVELNGSNIGTANHGLLYHRVSFLNALGFPVPVRAQHWLTNLAAGTHTFKLQWKQVNSGTDTFHIADTAANGMPTRLWLMEFDI